MLSRFTIPKENRIRHKLLGLLYADSRIRHVKLQTRITQKQIESELKLTFDELLTATSHLQQSNQIRILPPQDHGKDGNTYLLIEKNGTTAFLNKEHLFDGKKRQSELFKITTSYIHIPITILIAIMTIFNTCENNSTKDQISNLEEKLKVLEKQPAENLELENIIQLDSALQSTSNQDSIK